MPTLTLAISVSSGCHSESSTNRPTAGTAPTVNGVATRVVDPDARRQHRRRVLRQLQRELAKREFEERKINDVLISLERYPDYELTSAEIDRRGRESLRLVAHKQQLDDLIRNLHNQIDTLESELADEAVR
jgi:hypothetical protein